MRSKKLLALLLAVCMVSGCLSSAAAAASPVRGTGILTATNSGGGATQSTADDANGVITGSEAIRDVDPDAVTALDVGSSGAWTATPVDAADVSGDLSQLLSAGSADDALSTPETLENVYSESDIVTAFVVLESAPLAQTYSSLAMAPGSVVQSYAQQQASVMSAIQEEIDPAADMVAQFEFLTNSIVVSTEYGNLRTIAELDGVASVFVSPVFYPAKRATDAEKMTVSSGQMTNADDVWNLGEDTGYTGAGIKIAVLDTGIDLDHPSFSAAPKMDEEDSWDYDTVEGLIEKYYDELHAAASFKRLDAEYVYYSDKIPFIFNYAEGNNNVSHNDLVGDHGTHVSGIAAANEVEGTGVVGMAPDAQLIAMKVFNSSGSATLYDYVYALEDCVTLGVDIVNLSLGSIAGFTESGYEEIDNIFARLKDCDIVVNVAAGNEGNAGTGSLYGTDKALTSSIDNATVSSPATYRNVMAVASVNNDYVMSDYIELSDGADVFYQPTVELLYGYTDIDLQAWYSGESFEYVIIDGLGKYEDFYDADGNSLVSGKIAVIQRGTLNFGTKVDNAYYAGAVAAIIWDNVDEDIFTFGMTTSQNDIDSGEYSAIPAILISLSDGQKMADADDKTLTVPTGSKLRIDSDGGQMSSFTSWGASADLRLLPDLAGIGGNVYSCYDGGEYGLMSGTSMATPQVCGVTALVKQYLKDKFDARENLSRVAEALLMSTANPVIDDESKVEASPRQQGAGLVDALKAVTSGAYLTVDGGRPKAELGDDPDGKYSFAFEIHNFSDEAKTYTLSSSLLTEDFEKIDGLEYMAGWDTELDGTVSFDVEDDTVTVKAGKAAKVEVTITVSESGKKWLDKHFENGNYVEGYIYLTDTAEEGGVNMSLPFMGFYGSWSEVPMFDTGYWYSDSYWYYNGAEVDEDFDAEKYWHAAWVSMGVSVNDWLLGLNPYAGVLTEDGHVLYDEANNVVSPNGDGYLDKISDLYLSLMRNARYMWLSYTDEAGNDLCEPIMMGYEVKTLYNSSYGTTIPFVYDWYYTTPLYDFTDVNGDPLPDGTKVYLTVSAVSDYDLDEKVYCIDEATGEMRMIDDVDPDDSITIPITVDTTAPALKGVSEVTLDGKRYLVVTVDEAHPATVALMNPTGTQVYDQVFDNELTKQADGTWTAMLDITGHGNDFLVVIGDYGYNQGQYKVSRTASGDNSPVVDKTALYAYQVYDLGLYYYYGWDYMFGWTTVDTDPTSETTVTMLTSDAYEYYAVNAAEYVDGKVFAVDAGGNFLYMEPGLWNRTIICNIGYNVIDIAFDDATDTMYILISEEAEADDYESSDLYALATLDLLTGEVKILHNWGESDNGSGGGGIYFPPVASYADDGISTGDDYTYDYVNPAKYDMPWAMTFMDGYLYCCRFDMPGLYWLDFDAWELIPVMDDNYEDLIPALSNGYELTPYYAQSMTYSKQDNKIYWLYCDSGVNSILVTIDPNDWSYTLKSMGSTEYVGVLTLEDTEYKLPASDKVTGLAISETSVTLAVGDSTQLSVYALPWNAPAAEIYWDSDDIDEDVITIDENGTITAVGAGTASVFARCGEDADSYVEAVCEVTVLNIEGSFRAFNYSGDGNYGTWQDIDLKKMHGTDVAILNQESTVEFAAADYNGHDNCIYGFDANTYSAYKLNCATGEVTQLKSSSSDVCDMAYDYSRGMMFAITFNDATLYAMNLRTGELVAVASFDASFTPRTLACDWLGNLYAIDTEGYLYKITLVDNIGDDDNGDGGIGGDDPIDRPVVDSYDGEIGGIGDDWNFGQDTDEGSGEYSMTAYLTDLMEVPYNADTDYGQSMCYDYNNTYEDVLYWCNTNLDTFYQIVLPVTDEYGVPETEGSVYDLGTVDSHQYPQYLGMHVVPDDVWQELGPVNVTGITVESMFLLAGDSAQLEIEVEPLNANQDVLLVYAIDDFYAQTPDAPDAEDSTVVTVDQNGVVTAVQPGKAYVDIFALPVDTDLSAIEDIYEYANGDGYDSLIAWETACVTVKNPTTSRIRAYDYLSDVWLGVDQHAPAESSTYGNVQYQGSTYELTAAEYVGTSGLIYGYANDAAFFEPVEYFTVFDGSTLSVKSMTALSSDFPIVYDMAYDYTNGVMYALAGTANTVSLYYVDLETGALIEIAGMNQLGHTFLNITVNAEGTIYAMTNGNGELYTIQITDGVASVSPCPIVSTDTGNPYKSSLSYDFATGYLYWTPYENFYLIDLEDSSVSRVGSLPGENYALMLMAKDRSKYPAIPDALTAAMTTDVVELNRGDSTTLSYLSWPTNVAVTEAVWSSSDTGVATVDENGVVTGVASGTATVTVTLNGTATAACTVLVYGGNDTFLVYNVTDKGFSAISRTDSGKVTNLTSGEEASPVSAMTMLEDGTIYAYDEDGKLFTTSVADGFARTYIGHHGIDVSGYDDSDENAGQKDVAKTSLVIRDMTVLEDGTMLALGSITWNVHSEAYYNGELYYSSDYVAEPAEIGGAARLYQVNTETGALTELCVIKDSGNDMSGGNMLQAVGNNVYVYNTLNDRISLLDTTTGDSYPIVTLQSISVRGEAYQTMGMTYDEATNCLYMLANINKNYDRLVKYDIDSGLLSNLGIVGSVAYNDETWQNEGDIFHGLVIRTSLPGESEPEPTPDHEHKFVMTDSKAATCEEAGYEHYECECGEDSYDVTLPATSHQYVTNTNGDRQCVNCGKVVPVVPPVTPSRPVTPGDSGDSGNSGNSGDSETPATDLPFTDVKKDDWYYSAVEYAYSTGLMTGTGSGEFAPLVGTTRGMIVTVLARLEGVDTTGSVWYEVGRQWAMANGVSDGTNMEDAITREQLAAMLYRYAQLKGYDTTASTSLAAYKDASGVSNWAVEAMQWAVGTGLIQGSNGLLNPGASASRAEVATILMRFCQLFVG